MSFIKKFNKIPPQLDLDQEFYYKINDFLYRKEFCSIMDKILSKKIGHDFWFIVERANDIEKIEIILFTLKNKNEFNFQDAFYQKNYLQIFYLSYNLETTLNKIEHYIEKNGYKVINSWEIVDTETSHILSNSPEEEKENYLDFKKANTLKDKRAIIFKEQRPIYKELRRFKKKIGELINYEELRRLLEVFVRHEEEASDKERKTYYDSLSEQEKINKLDEIYLIILVFKNKLRKELINNE